VASHVARLRPTASHISPSVCFSATLFTAPNELFPLRETLSELFIRLRDRLPTSRFVDAKFVERLHSVGACWFDLAAIASVTSGGKLQLVKRPGELFAEFAPKHDEAEENVARAVFRMMAEIDSDEMMKPPTPITVLRLYCVEEMTADEIAAKCGCAKGTVVNRLRWIQQKTKRHPREFRRLAATFRKIEDDARDARAEYIHRKGMV
jgi:hypothetical protein